MLGERFPFEGLYSPSPHSKAKVPGMRQSTFKGKSTLQ